MTSRGEVMKNINDIKEGSFGLRGEAAGVVAWRGEAPGERSGS